MFLSYEKWYTNNFYLEQQSIERDVMLREVKDHLLRAQCIMKNNAYKHICDLEFSVGFEVYLKLRSYCQQLVSKRLSQNNCTILWSF